MVTQNTNWVIYEDQFWSGYNEVMAQNADIFNAASANALRVVSLARVGNFAQQAFIKAKQYIFERDPTGVGAAADVTMDAGEFVQPKVNRRIGPVTRSIDSWRKVGESPQRMSFALGQQTARESLIDYVNTLVAALAGAIGAVDAGADTVVETQAANITHGFLNTAFGLMGDRRAAIRAVVMHSKPFNDLVADNIAQYKIDSIAGVNIVQGETYLAFGRPIVVTDSADMVIAGTPDTYRTFILQEMAATVEESEQGTMDSEIRQGQENLIMSMQGEYAFNVNIMGMAFSTATISPTRTQLATAGNWSKAAESFKDTAGTMLITQ